MAATKTPSRISINVTEADIERAIRNDSYTCVVAQALARTVPLATNIDVDTQSIRFTVDQERRVYMTPYAVQGYVIAFDAGDAIEPFTFQLRDPRRVARRIKTEAGKVAQRAYNKAYRTQSTAKKATPDKPEDTKKAAKAAYAEARQQNPGQVGTTLTGKQTTPRVFKRKRRAYGHRLLRINQEA